MLHGTLNPSWQWLSKLADIQFSLPRLKKIRVSSFGNMCNKISSMNTQSRRTCIVDSQMKGHHEYEKSLAMCLWTLCSFVRRILEAIFHRRIRILCGPFHLQESWYILSWFPWGTNELIEYADIMEKVSFASPLIAIKSLEFEAFGGTTTMICSPTQLRSHSLNLVLSQVLEFPMKALVYLPSIGFLETTALRMERLTTIRQFRT